MSHDWILQVTAGPEYDTKTHQIVHVNTAEPLHIESEHASIDLNVRIQSYTGLPRTSPPTSPYFDHPPHDKTRDQYSIAFRFVPKSPINGNDLVFGNDFDNPIRDRLPPGFNTAFRIVKWAIDPGLDGDVYADMPYLYGPLVSSLNTFRVGEKEEEEESASGKLMGGEGEGMLIEEGGEGDGLTLREDQGVPEGEAARKKHFLVEENRRKWEFEKGRAYWGDFYNPYLDFNEFSLRLPGFTLPIMKYWDGQALRYVLKNRKTDTLLLAVTFALYLKEDVDENGHIREGAAPGKGRVLAADGGVGNDNEEEEEEEDDFEDALDGDGDGDESEKGKVGGGVETSADDVD